MQITALWVYVKEGDCFEYKFFAHKINAIFFSLFMIMSFLTHAMWKILYALCF